MVYTSLSREIISHETAHAILDGIAPDLYHASDAAVTGLARGAGRPDSGHSVLQKPNSGRCCPKRNQGEIDRPSEFSSIAREFGREASGSDALRELYYKRDIVGKVGPEPHYL